MTDPLLGSAAGELTLEACIAIGGFGAVYRARGGPRGVAAVKVLGVEQAGSAEAVARFAREVEVLGRVRHPGLVDMLAIGRLDDGRPFFAMELLEGSDLQSTLAARGRLGAVECLRILGAVCDALAAAHGAGVIHRDIKASNVFLTRDGRVVLLDFGIARLVDPGVAGLTGSRQAIGTPSCMAPEQIAGKPATTRTDVYGLGALFFHMVTGAPPFADESPTVMHYLHAHARRPRPSARLGLPPATDEVIAIAMAIDPERRYGSPREMLAATRAALGAGGSPAETRAALAVRVDVRLTASDDAELSPALDDADAVWSAARAHFSTRGFVPALEASESILFVRPMAADSAGAGDLTSIEAIGEFERLIADRDGRHPLVAVTVFARRGEAAFSGATPVGGPLLDLGSSQQRSQP